MTNTSNRHDALPLGGNKGGNTHNRWVANLTNFAKHWKAASGLQSQLQKQIKAAPKWREKRKMLSDH